VFYCFYFLTPFLEFIYIFLVFFYIIRLVFLAFVCNKTGIKLFHLLVVLIARYCLYYISMTCILSREVNVLYAGQKLATFYTDCKLTGMLTISLH
jgi:hypothetical protein